jgi:hypothetical protein
VNNIVNLNMGESNKRGLHDLSSSFAEAVLRSPKKQREGSTSITDANTSNPSPIGASTPVFHSTPGLITCNPAFHPNTQPQYVVSAPVSISPDDIQRIAVAVRDAVKESLREEFSAIIEEKIAPLHKEINTLKTENNDLRRQLDELEQYGRRPLIRISGIPEMDGEDTTTKILEATTSAGIPLQSDDIIISHRVGKQKKGPRQIIARLKSVDTKFFILRNSAKFRKHEQTKRISVNEDLTRYRDRLLFLCRQLCREQKLKNARSTNGKITVKDRQDRVHHIRDERDLTKFGHEIKDT